ncbi:MAG: HD domain-containing protein [Oscillospiraceae bacterium]|jgi:uncharacterized protein|nr:HD domain-containing protein [Oscillospiraceae bacterium]
MSFAWQAYCAARTLTPEKEPAYFAHVQDLLATKELQSLNEIPHHIPTTLLTHVSCVSFVAWRLTQKLGGDARVAARGGLLHDLYYYDWHDFSDDTHRWHGVLHPSRALKNATALLGELDQRTANAIVRHMFPFTPIPPKYRESILVSVADKICSYYDVMLARFASYRARFARDTGIAYDQL